MSSLTTQLTNSSQPSSVLQGLINFRSFDKTIEEELDLNLAYSHRLINERDKPAVMDSLREYLVKAVGCFTTVGYVNITDISYWFERETVIESFDELLLKFRDYLNTTKGVTTTEQYTLMRYRDHLNFVITQQQGDAYAPLSFLGSEQNVTEIKGIKVIFDNLQHELETEYGEQINVEGLMQELKGDNFEGLLSKYLLPKFPSLLD